jgi:hypothetical protein
VAWWTNRPADIRRRQCQVTMVMNLRWKKIEILTAYCNSNLTAVQIGTFLCRVGIRYYMKGSYCHIREVDAREEPTAIFGFGSIAPIAML